MNVQSLLRALPRTDDVLDHLDADPRISYLQRDMKREIVQNLIQQQREHLMHQNSPDNHDPEIIARQIVTQAIDQCLQLKENQLIHVINATGVVLHTNLGRAPLGKKVEERLQCLVSGYSNLELNLHTGKRGSRYDHVRQLLIRLTGAEDVLVVNNNAGAILLALASIGKGREVILSRGELVEIGGSFRIPEVMAQSGALLREVGTTNRTHVKDYEAAINENTGALLKVHQSNFRIVGFTAEASVSDLVQLSCRHNIPLINDLGSGLLVDLTPYGLPEEPTVQQALAFGTDVVTFSGDKLLGGTQAGIIAGKKRWIDQIASHPLTRALRVDKLTLAGLETTLQQYLDPENALVEIPTLRMLTEQIDMIKERAESIFLYLQACASHQKNQCHIRMEPGFSKVGGGAYPGLDLPSWLIGIETSSHHVTRLDRHLRNASPAVLGRIQEHVYWMDARTIQPHETQLLCQTIESWICGE